MIDPVPHAGGRRIYLLEPPYRSRYPARSTRSVAPPIGTVVRPDTGHFASDVFVIRDVLSRWPWILPCLNRAAAPPDAVRLVVEVPWLQERTALVEDAGRAESIVSAIRQRPPPSPALAAEYAAGRFGHAVTVVALTTQFAFAAGELSESAIDIDRAMAAILNWWHE